MVLTEKFWSFVYTRLKAAAMLFTDFFSVAAAVGCGAFVQPRRGRLQQMSMEYNLSNFDWQPLSTSIGSPYQPIPEISMHPRAIHRVVYKKGF